MRDRRDVLNLGVLAAGAALVGCTPSQTQRLKVTVSVIDNGVLRTGSSVMESTCWQTNNKLGGMGIGGCHMSGEAVWVDLKQRGYLFMILCGRNDFLLEGGMGGIMGSKPEWDSKTWIVKRDKIPRLVAFTDTSDSRTVIEVDPENLAATYGKGVTLASVVAKYTDEPITQGVIERALPWLLTIGHNNLEGHFATNGLNLSGRLSGYHFATEVEELGKKKLRGNNRSST